MIRHFLLLILLCQPLLSAELPFHPFTAEVAKKKVRLRTRPELDAPIVRELTQGDLIVVDDEQTSFYQVRPPRDLKLYLFRTFVLDGMVEGSRVNVRLAPDLEAPVVAQLSTGDVVVGSISSLHPKWMEIAPPDSVRFFVAKDFVEEVGDENYLALHEERKSEVEELMALGEKGKQSLSLPFETISLDALLLPFVRVKEEYKEFHHELVLAEESIRSLNQAYLLKKIAYLEEKTNIIASILPPIEEVVVEDVAFAAFDKPVLPPVFTNPRSYWLEIERGHFAKWREERGGKGDPESFYALQSTLVEPLKGIIEPYLRQVRQKPGDFVLVDSESREPIAYLYTTRVNLLDMMGQEVELKAIPRPNNEFAHPAYFVWEVER